MLHLHKRKLLLLFRHSLVSDSLQPRAAARQAALSFTTSQGLLKLMSTESVMPSNRLILCHPLLLLPSIFPSIRVFSNEPALRIRWPKGWSFSLSISPSSEYSGLISFRIDWFQISLKFKGLSRVFFGTTIQCSAFFIVQLSHSCMTIRKTTALTRGTFVCKVMSLLFHMVPRFIIVFESYDEGTLLSLKKEENCDTATTWMNLRTVH